MNKTAHKMLTAKLSGLIAGMMVLNGFASAAPTEPTAQQAQDLQLTVSGEGRPVLMIPGLNSAASTWTETCAQLQPGVRCLMVQLPGFAGQAPLAKKDGFLEQVKGQLQALLKAEAPAGAVVVGHSLGGVLGLMLAADDKAGSVKQLVVVDSLPFLPGIQSPTATIEDARPRAEAMRQGMSRVPADREQQRAQLTAMMAGMSRSSERVAQIVRWSMDSDAPTSGQAMYELMTTDLRPLLPRIQVPTTVLGSWAAYAQMGSTQASTRAIFERQYTGLKGVALQMSEQGYHFLMWDDPALVQGAIKKALAAH